MRSIWWANKRLHGRRGAAIGHESERRAGHALKVRADDVRRAAGACGSLQGLVRVGLEPRPQFLEIIGGKILARVDQLRIARDERDRREVLEHIVAERIDGAVEHVRADLPDAQRIAVRRRAHRSPDRDAAAGRRRYSPSPGSAPARRSCAAQGCA